MTIFGPIFMKKSTLFLGAIYSRISCFITVYDQNNIFFQLQQKVEKQKHALQTVINTYRNDYVSISVSRNHYGVLPTKTFPVSNYPTCRKINLLICLSF